MSTVIQFAVLGLGIGAIYALLTQGVILIYSGSGVLNLAHGAMAMLGAYLFWDLHVKSGWAFWPAFIVAVVSLMACGALIQQLLMRPLRRASSLARVVVTLGLLVTFQGIVALKWGVTPQIISSDLPRHTWLVGHVAILEDRLLLLAVALGITAAVSVFYKYTSVGLALRASSTNARGIAALGWSADMLATLTWTIGAGLAAIAGIFIAPIIGLSTDQMPLLIVPVLAAALVGGFVSFWLTFVGSVVIGIAQSELSEYVHFQNVEWSAPFIVIVLLLVVRGKSLPVRGVVAERLPKVGSGEIRWLPLIVTTGVMVYLILSVFPRSLLDALTQSFGWALLMLSVVVLLGFTSQLSFEQMAMAGIATLVAARLVEAAHVPFGFAAILGLLAAVPIGVIFALPALRTRGINLAVVTLGLGVVVVEMILTNPRLIGFEGSGIPVSLPTLFGVDIDAIRYPERYALLVFAVFVVASIAVANLRRGKAGSALIAVRTNERAAAALGINVLSTKLFAFVVGASLAAAGGILIAFRSPIITFDEYTPYNSILVVSYAVIGGVGYALGPAAGLGLVGGGFGGWVLSRFYSNAYRAPYWLIVLGGVMVIITILGNPDGLIELKAKLIGGAFRALRRLLPWRAATPVPAQIEEQKRHKAVPAELEIRDLTVRFGGTVAVDSVSITLGPGQILGLIGPNGAGKTTVIDAVTGYVKPAAGQVFFNGEAISSWPVHRRVAQGLSRSFQSLELFEDSTVRENLRVASDDRSFLGYFLDLVHPRHRPLSAAAAAAVREFGLEWTLDSKVKDLPYGQRRLVAIARTLAVDPSIVLLDEPAAGLSGVETRELSDIVARLAKEWGFAVLVVEHDMSFVMGLCDRVVVLDFGRKIAEGSPDEIQSDPAVITAYLGQQDGGEPLLSPNVVEA